MLYTLIRWATLPLVVLALFFSGHSLWTSSSEARMDSHYVVFQYPKSSYQTNKTFNIQATTHYNTYYDIAAIVNGNNNAYLAANCDYQVDDGTYNPMTVTGGNTHSTTVSNLTMGDHTITLACNPYYTGSNNLIPVANAQAYSFYGTVAFTVVGTGSGTTVNTGGGGGGMLGYYTCVNQMCTFVTGTGANTCSTSLDCASATNENENMNGNQNVNENLNTNENTNGSSAGVNPGFPYTDLSGHWSYQYVYDLWLQCPNIGARDAAGNLLTNLFQPDTKITRADLSALLVGCQSSSVAVIGMSDQLAVTSFTDVAPSDWFYSDVMKAKELGWIEGYPDGTFGPNENIIRVEALKIILLSKYLPAEITGGVMNFLDTVAGEWYEKYIAFAGLKNIMNGYKDKDGNLTGYFGPSNPMTRAEAVKVILKTNGW